MTFGASLALIAEVTPEGKKGKVLSLTGLLWTVGAVVPAFLGGAVGGLADVGARVLYGQLLVVAIVVLVFRRTVPESPKWLAATATASVRDAQGDRVEFSRLPELFRRPLLAPLVVAGMAYALANIPLNTFGQFAFYIFVNLLDVPPGTTAVAPLVMLPVGVVAVLILMRVADRPTRQRWTVIGGLVATGAFLVPLVAGTTLVTFLVLMVLVGFGTNFIGEPMDRVWAPEFFPTLLRSSAQGVTIAFARGSPGSSPWPPQPSWTTGWSRP